MEEGGRRRRLAGDWTRSLHTQLKESSAQRHSLATCVLTFVFLSVVIYGSTDLKAKLAAPSPTSHTNSWNVGWAPDCQEASGGPPRAAVLFSPATQPGRRRRLVD